MSREQRQAIRQMLKRSAASTGPQTVEQIRAGFAALMATRQVPTEIRTEEALLAGRPALVVEPSAGTRPGTILYFHGGAYVFGSPRTALSMTANLVVRTGLRGVSLDYRLAPEHPFPTAVD